MTTPAPTLLPAFAPTVTEALPPMALVVATAVAAATAPSLLAYNLSPSPTFLNQALALALWALWVVLGPPGPWGKLGMAGMASKSGMSASWRSSHSPLFSALPALLAIGVLALAAGLSYAFAGLPAALTLSALGLLLAAAVLLVGGTVASQSRQRETLFVVFCVAWVVAGLANTGIALVQVFAPTLADGHWIALAQSPGRAIGNLRQPNHLSSLLLWAVIAVVALAQLKRLRTLWAGALVAVLVFAVVLSASRTGVVSVALLALWGLLDKRLHKSVRFLLVLAPLFYAAAWLGMAQWAHATQAAFGGEQRLAETDISGSRFGIWANTLALIGAQPFTGVGFGNFNFAWTLTPFPGRPVAFFDHTHNLLLQWAVELGLPATALLVALLLWALWRAAKHAWRGAASPAGATTQAINSARQNWRSAQSCALMMVLMIALHSLLEYPLWYAYFLLPTCWALGFALGAEPVEGAEPVKGAELVKDAGAAANPLTSSSPVGAGYAVHAAQDPAVANPSPALATTAAFWQGRACQALAAVVLVGAVYAVWDYRSVARIFFAGTGASSLEARIAQGKRSTFFSHHANYAAATSGMPAALQEGAYADASRYLLDTRFMMAWAKHEAALGHVEEARTIAARLREFRKADAAAFFAVCGAAAAPAVAPSTAAPTESGFQCQAPTAELGWRRLATVLVPAPR